MASSDHPLKYSHLDIAGSSGGLPHPTTGSAVTALVMHFLAKWIFSLGMPICHEKSCLFIAIGIYWNKRLFSEITQPMLYVILWPKFVV